MRYGKRVDGNHKEIRDGLRKVGYKVRDYSAQGDGVPDVCVMVLPGYSLFLEIKDPTKPKSDQKLTTKEEEWLQFNSSITRTVFSLEEALHVLSQYKGELCLMQQRAA
jgi:hypothetical protein